METSDLNSLKLTPVATFSCFYCELRKLGQPQVTPYNDKLLTRWHVQYAGHHWMVAKVSDEPLGHGQTCTCDQEIPWDIYCDSECEEALDEFATYLSDGGYKQIEPPNDISE